MTRVFRPPNGVRQDTGGTLFPAPSPAVFWKTFGPLWGRRRSPAPRPDGSGVALSVLLSAAAFGAGLAVLGISWRFWRALVHNGLLRYADSGLPMLASPDSFFQLAAGRAMLEEGLRFVPGTAPGSLLAFVSGLTGLSPEGLAFGLTIPLLLLPGLSVAPWAMLLRLGPAAAAVGAFCLTLFPASLVRASPGLYDADPALLALWNLLFYFTARLDPAWRGATGRAAAVWLACAVLLVWCWPPGVWASLGCLWLAALSRPRSRLRSLLLVLVPLLILGALLIPAELLPNGLISLRDELRTGLLRLFGGERDLFTRSLAELSALSGEAWLRGIGGTATGGVACLAAAALLLALQPRFIPYLLPSLLMLPAGGQSSLLLYLGGLPVALGIAALPSNLERIAAFRFPWGNGKTPFPSSASLHALGLGAALWFAWNLADVQRDWTWPTSVQHTVAEDRVLIALRPLIGPDVSAFNWWDDGSVLRARTGIEPFSDSGNRGPLSAFIAGRGLGLEDPLQARRWIRFFARRGPRALEPFYRLWGGQEAAFALLEQIFARDDARAALELYPFPATYGPDWFFPSGRVVLYLPERFLLLNMWWMALGSDLRAGPEALRQHLERFPRTGFGYDPVTGEVTVPEAVLQRGYRSVGGVFLTHREPLAPPFGAEARGPLLVTSFRSPWLYLVDQRIIRTLAFRLLAPSGENLAGFRPIALDPAAAGAWEVLP